MQKTDRRGRLLRYDAVPQGLQLLSAGQTGDIGDVARGEAHHPLDE